MRNKEFSDRVGPMMGNVTLWEIEGKITTDQLFDFKKALDTKDFGTVLSKYDELKKFNK